MFKVLLTSLLYSFVLVYFGGLFITFDWAWIFSTNEEVRAFALLFIVWLTGTISILNTLK